VELLELPYYITYVIFMDIGRNLYLDILAHHNDAPTAAAAAGGGRETGGVIATSVFLSSHF